MNHPLRLLTENEIFRLNVWTNPTNDPKRGTDVIGTALTEVIKTTSSSSPQLNAYLQGSWPGIVRTVWQINPAIAVFMPERFKSPVVRNEVSKLVRSSTLDVLDIPEALPFLLGDRVDPNVRRDLKVWQQNLQYPQLNLFFHYSIFFSGHLLHLSLLTHSSNHDLIASH